MLSVGRAVREEGLSTTLLAALALLPPELHWRFVHVGGGAARRRLQARRPRALGIAERIEWRGARPQAEVLAAYRDADLFVLASRDRATTATATACPTC